ncbi:MAG TPA: hypothetical protein VFI31_24980 [Pirellulales bacterium]|nr:hypothetical protein [Pirellulales bacterium]
MRSATFFLLAAILVAYPGPSSYAQYGWPYGGYYASTAGEGYAMGMASMVRSAGMATLMTSEAAVNAQQAGSMYIDNTVKATQAYIDRQAMLGSYQASLRKPPPTAEQLYRMSQMGLPKALSAKQLDPVTGAISWPVVLRDEPFDSYRETAQKFFHEAVANPQSFTYDAYNQVQQAGSECLALLKSRIKDYRPNDFIEAKKFVEGLNYAAQQL